MGTLLFGSTVFTIFPIVITVCNSWRNNVCNLSKLSIFTTLICLPFVIINATTNTFVTCAANGVNFYNSMKHSFKIVLQDSVMFTTTRLVRYMYITREKKNNNNLTLNFVKIY